ETFGLSSRGDLQRKPGARADFSWIKRISWQLSCSRKRPDDILRATRSDVPARGETSGCAAIIASPEMKILLIEDHPGSRRNLQRLIARRGHEVIAVGSAEEAEAALAAETFPFLILDWMLPGKSGVELCRELRGRPDGDEMFILLVTATADTEDLEQALAAG